MSGWNKAQVAKLNAFQENTLVEFNDYKFYEAWTGKSKYNLSMAACAN